MTQTKAELKEIAQRANAIYAERIRAEVEPEHHGKLLVVNVDTGEYVMDEDDSITSRHARETFGPKAHLFGIRVGYPFVYAYRPPAVRPEEKEAIFAELQRQIATL